MRLFADAVRKAVRKRALRDVELAELGTTISETKTPGVLTASFAGEGVYVTPTPVTAGEEVQVWYSGLLSKSGAKKVFLHSGVGPGAWQQIKTTPMVESSPGVFKCSIRAADGGRLEMCFHDDAYNWDNNNGRNWSYTIHNGYLQ